MEDLIEKTLLTLLNSPIQTTNYFSLIYIRISFNVFIFSKILLTAPDLSGSIELNKTDTASYPEDIPEG